MKPTVFSAEPEPYRLSGAGIGSSVSPSAVLCGIAPLWAALFWPRQYLGEGTAQMCTVARGHSLAGPRGTGRVLDDHRRVTREAAFK